MSGIKCATRSDSLAEHGAARQIAPEASELRTGGAHASVTTENRSLALGDIARHHHESLIRFLTVRTGSRDDAREIAQEAYVRLLALDRPGPISFPAGYLWRIAANLAINRKRSRAVRQRFADLARREDEKLAPSAERVAEARERLAIVEQAIGELPPRCLEAFNLRVIRGMRFEEVGREMRTTDRMAQIYVARALEYLQSRLDDADAPGGRR